jgi:hypothetical protein
MGSIVIADSGDYIVQAASIPNYNSISVAGWWYRTSSTSATTRRVLTLYAADDSMNVGIGTEEASGENLFKWHGSLSAFSPAATTTLIPNDAWYYVAVAGAATEVNYYIWDAAGDLLTSGTRTATLTGAPADVTIGARYGSSYRDHFCPGKYAYWKVWNTTISAEDFATQQFEPDWVVGTSNKHSGFNDTTTDTSGNSRTWTHWNTTTDSGATPPVLTGCTITDAGDELYRADDSVTITGTNFGAVEGDVYVSPTDNVADAAKVTQTVTAWADTSITFTAVRSTLATGSTLYLFVVPDTNDPNADGYSVAFEYVPITLTWAM